MKKSNTVNTPKTGESGESVKNIYLAAFLCLNSIEIKKLNREGRRSEIVESRNPRKTF